MTRPALPERAFAAFLFDMDGTLLSSIACAERVWARWAGRHGVDVAAFLPTIHGMRAAETIARLNLPGVDVEAEAAVIHAEEMVDVDGIAATPAMAAFLAAMRLRASSRGAGLPAPPMMVTAEDVADGKPAPDCFLLAASRLGVPASDCLVFEDAPAGIAAAEAAGASVMVVTATHAHPLDTPHPGIVGYTAVVPRVEAGGALRLVPAAG